MNTQVGCIARLQARMAGLAPFPSPSLEASPDDIVEDDKDGANSSSVDEMTS